MYTVCCYDLLLRFIIILFCFLEQNGWALRYSRYFFSPSLWISTRVSVDTTIFRGFLFFIVKNSSIFSVPSQKQPQRNGEKKDFQLQGPDSTGSDFVMKLIETFLTNDRICFMLNNGLVGGEVVFLKGTYI